MNNSLIYLGSSLNIFAMSIGIPALRAKLAEDIEASMQYARAENSNDLAAYKLNDALLKKIEKLFVPRIQMIKDSGQLNTPTRLYRWAPIHIAVITGNYDALMLLVDAGAMLDIADARGMTPLHYAALLGNALFISALVYEGARTDLECASGGTFLDILQCIDPPSHSSDQLLNILDSRGEQKLTVRDFSSLTQATYLFETQLTPAQMFEEIFDESPKENYYHFAKDYVLYYRCLKAPLLRLKEATHDAAGRLLTISPGIGLFATEDIKCGAFIGEFKGVFTNKCPYNDFFIQYFNGKAVDGEEFRNEMLEINDGFPNVVVVPLRSVAGLTSRHILIAAEKIEKGTQLCCNYGYMSNFKHYLPYVRLRPDETLKFLQKYPISFLVDTLAKASKKECTLEEYFIAEKFRYILQTPPVLFSIALSLTLEENAQLISASQTLNCLSKDELQQVSPLFTLIPGFFLAINLLNLLPALIPKLKNWISTIPSIFGLVLSIEVGVKANQEIIDIIKANLSEEEALKRWDLFELKYRIVAKRTLQTLIDLYSQNTLDSLCEDNT